MGVPWENESAVEQIKSGKKKNGDRQDKRARYALEFALRAVWLLKGGSLHANTGRG
ncbi:hypothetical protein [Paraburkholderia sp. SG-MS1]|uniref:hypothetical protein n=1 Tax=Paraburkholderia sp. SG-MS1 TaxID=2023741 RepID=UPI0014480845|nr:hypothetical protein [Paraburkholderia sp. SG-MS1]